MINGYHLSFTINVFTPQRETTMANSASSSPSSKERTTPWRETPAVLPPEREKKTEKKLETPVLVAIISAVVTLVTATLGSPLLVSLVNKANTPASTPAGEFVALESSLLSPSPSESQLTKATFTPVESGIGLPELTSTILPPQNPNAATPAAASFFQCIATDLWFPYPATINPEISNGCWNLTDWGFSTDGGRLLLVHNPDQDQQRGIYLPFSGDVEIRFWVQLNKFRTHSNKVGFLNFGIVQNDPFSIFTGGYLSYQQTAPGSASPVRVLISGSDQATQKISDQKAGFQHEVLFSVKEDVLRVYLNGEQTGHPVNLPPTERAFWIGYVLPSNGELDAMITDLTIVSR